MKFDHIEDPLERAQFKQSRGFGTSNTEKRLLSDAAKGRLPSAPFKIPDLKKPPLTAIEQVEGLQAALRKAAASAAASGTSNELHYDDGIIQIDIDGSGIVLTNGTHVATIDSEGNLSVTDGTRSLTLAADSILTINTGTNTLTLDYTLLTHNMAITEWDVCNSGSPGNALFVSSDPY